MWENLPLFPQQASTLAPRVDALYFFLILVSVFFAGLIFVLIFYFAVKYRRRSDADQPRAIEGSIPLEIVWTVVPFALTLVMFGWGAWLFAEIHTPPRGALEINVVGKQWMWKIQHPNGQQEINELHVPVGQAVKLLMTSEDVIHDFFVPAFRVKSDVLPGRYTQIWFHATKPGEYRFFCSQYCGTQHSGMIGRVIVMEIPDFQKWLSGGAAGVSTAQLGEKLFESLGCVSCHRPGGAVQAPSLAGLVGKPVKLEGGKTITADESYIRESILDPRAKIVAGYQPVMPSYKGSISEDGIMQIIAYLKTFNPEEGEARRP
jgi:cytochrome c oxidase subunit II